MRADRLCAEPRPATNPSKRFKKGGRIGGGASHKIRSKDVPSGGLASREQEEDGQGADGGNTDHAPVAVEVGDQLAVPRDFQEGHHHHQQDGDHAEQVEDALHHVGGEEGAELVAGSTCRRHGLGELTGAAERGC